ncbi:hypothetical protein BDP27DRAFT_1415831 [Rhodocollybia butyracea]|uniref:Uncharacterized protein n=1 Tax=Rhodocollybia butyracea TaxID=206335 RepID=A0A9P5Q5F9_9AGAR|nr:hypothetical protein BDP27DRAFT_1415831 [Rhodocollybia butyracea]
MSNVNISLEDHLVSALEPLVPIIDVNISKTLVQSLSEQIIPYTLLQSVSRWSRSPEGSSALRSHSLDPNAYSMISLLAGTTTSPERKFGPYVAPLEPEQLVAEGKRERKAITTIINGVLSVIGSGAAAWIMSEQTHWKREWRMLFALFVAVIVAVAETVLYIIWQSRSSSSSLAPRPPKSRRKRIQVKKEDVEELITSSADGKTLPEGLRLRTQLKK